MKYLKQLMIILVTYLAGQALQALLHLSVPGSVIGLILLLLALRKGTIKVEIVEDVCEFLLSNMSFLFISAGVGLIISSAALKGNWFGFITILITLTAVAWIITTSAIQLFRRGNSHEWNYPFPSIRCVTVVNRL